MAGTYDFGSGMPLPHTAGPTTVYNSISTFHNPRSYFANVSNFPTHQPLGGGHGREYPAAFNVDSYYRTLPHDRLKKERRDSAKPTDYYPFHDNVHGRLSANGMPQLAKRMDHELLDYLHQRRVSPFFVHEIDQFLATHPELADLRPDWVGSLYKLRPLEAYRFFLKGYTKPARYQDYTFPTRLSTAIIPPVIPLLANAYDIELIEFFEGYSYRYDLLEMIDHHVADLVRDHEHGIRLTPAQFKLTCFVMWGQPVDAYKYFEYNYQSEWLAHRYLPEHVILHELPKAANYEEPKAYDSPHPDERPETMDSYPGTRLQMARACDAGVDVIDVLMEEFVSDLARRGFGRCEIDALRRRAEKEVDHQRKIKGSADIVDLVMGLAQSAQSTAQNRSGGPYTRRRTVNRRIFEARKELEHVLSHHYKYKDQKKGDRRIAERELVLAVITQATRDQTMTRYQAAELLAMVPNGKTSRAKRERKKGVPDVLRALSMWL